MGNSVRSHLIRIGNSRGVRIPKLWLEQLDLGGEIELAVEANGLVIRAARRPRQDWDERFRAMHRQSDDRLIADIPGPAWDDREWEW